MQIYNIVKLEPKGNQEPKRNQDPTGKIEHKPNDNISITLAWNVKTLLK